MQGFNDMKNIPYMSSPMMMPNPMAMQNPMMMPNPMMMQNQMMNLLQMENMLKMQQMMNPFGNKDIQENKRLSRIKKEFYLCQNDSDLLQIGCSFLLDQDNNYNVWRVTMVGPQDSPYRGGLFTLKIYFPPEYPSKGAEFRFVTKVYHLNVDWKSPETLEHISLSYINEWRVTGKVGDKPCYGVKQALFDIFCLFYNQGADSPYDEEMANLYRNNREKFNAIAEDWTEKYAK